MMNDELEVLLTEDKIKERVKELAQKISKDFAGEPLLVVGILKGAFIFMADLVRNLEMPVVIDFMDVSSYGYSTESSGEVRIMKDLEVPIEGKNVLIVEDIVDTGLTLQYIVSILKKRHPKSLRICAFLDKPSRRKTDVVPDYCGFVIPDKFVVGYGLDCAERYRNLPWVAVLKQQD